MLLHKRPIIIPATSLGDGPPFAVLAFYSLYRALDFSN
jgi:hypothetical protein